MSQWTDEIRTLFTPKGIDIFTYPTSKEEREFFWEADGHFEAMRHSLSSVIIFVTQSVSNSEIHTFYMCLPAIQTLQREYSELYETKPKRGAADLPWALPGTIRTVTPERLSRSLFGRSYLSGIVDEAHSYRNCGPKHAAALRLLKKCVVRMPLTAMPLQTCTRVSDMYFSYSLVY